MREFFILDDDDAIVADGVLFSSGAVAVSFLQAGSGIATNFSMDRARYQHETLGKRRLAWKTDVMRGQTEYKVVLFDAADFSWARWSDIHKTATSE